MSEATSGDDRADAGAPLLSVVVPFYNVEAYLEECLRSLQDQTLTDLEVILVDDGSPDNSVDIARRFVEEDPRFTLVRQENRGLGPARNTGVERARGKYLAFVDSDDVVAPRAYALMVDSLEATGSAFVAADVYRFSATSGFRQSWTHRTVCSKQRIRTTLAEHPELMGDRMVWNKVYRRSFWDAHQLEFPAIKYEDYPVTLRAYLEAPAVDVLTNHVYFWRERESGDSITQQSERLDNVRDRYLSAVSVLDVLDRHFPTPELVRVRVHGYLIHIDMVAMAESMVRCPPEDRPEIERMLLALARRLDPGAGVRATRLARLIHRALLADDLETVRDLATWRLYGNRAALLRRMAARGQVWRLPAVMRATGLLRRRLGPWKERRLKSVLHSASWDGDELRVTVRSTLRRSFARLVRARGELTDYKSRTGLPTTVRAVAGGVESDIRIGADDLAGLQGAGWTMARLWVSLRMGPFHWRGPVRFEVDQLPGVREIRGDWWVQPRNVNGTFGLQRMRDPFVVDGAQADGPSLRLLGGPPGRTLTIARPDPAEDLTYTFDDAGMVEVPARALIRSDPPDNRVSRTAERAVTWVRPRTPVELHRARADALARTAREYDARIKRAERSGGPVDELGMPDPTEVDETVAEPVLMREATATVRLGDVRVGVRRTTTGAVCIRQEPVEDDFDTLAAPTEELSSGRLDGEMPIQAAAVADVDAAAITESGAGDDA